MSNKFIVIDREIDKKLYIRKAYENTFILNKDESILNSQLANIIKKVFKEPLSNIILGIHLPIKQKLKKEL